MNIKSLFCIGFFVFISQPYFFQGYGCHCASIFTKCLIVRSSKSHSCMHDSYPYHFCTYSYYNNSSLPFILSLLPMSLWLTIVAKWTVWHASQISGYLFAVCVFSARMQGYSVGTRQDQSLPNTYPLIQHEVTYAAEIALLNNPQTNHWTNRASINTSKFFFRSIFNYAISVQDNILKYTKTDVSKFLHKQSWYFPHYLSSTFYDIH